eukprot:SAG11_NODE_4155_length_2037_cov_0.977296_5_plen_157_part_00
MSEAERQMEAQLAGLQIGQQIGQLAAPAANELRDDSDQAPDCNESDERRVLNNVAVDNVGSYRWIHGQSVQERLVGDVRDDVEPAAEHGADDKWPLNVSEVLHLGHTEDELRSADHDDLLDLFEMVPFPFPLLLSFSFYASVLQKYAEFYPSGRVL